jgi:DNA helicase II / ATP-dependent DNA helicase PcrA
MILVRSAYAARALQASLLAKNIPYSFIGGVKLLESAHVRDLLSVLRLVANPRDEIGWMRFLTLWKGVGEVTASRLIDRIMSAENLEQCLDLMSSEAKLPNTARSTIGTVRDFQNDVAKALSKAYSAMEEVLAAKYKNQEWDKRRNDFSVIEKLAQKHSSILEFIEAYVLDPLYVTARRVAQNDNDVVTVITIHSAKGTEREVCYVLNVSPQAYPLSHVVGKPDKVEEERRVLYVALTRAKDELIITRHCSSANGGYTSWAHAGISPQDINSETYFLNSLPEDLFVETVHQNSSLHVCDAYIPKAGNQFAVGIKID